jgi:hypothetical protein
MNNIIQQTFNIGEVDRIKLMTGFLNCNINPRKSSDSIGSISEIKMNCRSNPAACEECKTILDETDILNSIANKKPTIELDTDIYKILFIEDVKNIFFSNFRSTYEKLNTELKEFIAGNILEIPNDIREMFSKDTVESVRLAIAKNTPSEKKTAQSEQQIAPPVKGAKKGFFGKLFG